VERSQNIEKTIFPNFFNIQFLYFLKKMDIVLFGIQWSGKWTQAHKILKENQNFSYLSTGDFFRSVCTNPNAIWDFIKKKINNWLLVPDDFTISVFHLFLKTVGESDRILLDWYPRSIAQIDDLIDTYQKNKRKIIWINLVISDEVAIQRAMSRWRDDDTIPKIKTRIEEYYKNTKPTIDYFGQKFDLINIDAQRPIDQIFEDIKKYI